MTVDNPAASAVKADNFRRLGTKRVTAAIEKIRLVGNLSSRASYSYTPEQVEKIRDVLRSEVDRTMERFVDNKPKPAFEV